MNAQTEVSLLQSADFARCDPADPLSKSIELDGLLLRAESRRLDVEARHGAPVTVRHNVTFPDSDSVWLNCDYLPAGGR